MPAFERRLKQHGIALRSALVPGRSQAQIFVADPAGNGVEFNFEHGAA